MTPVDDDALTHNQVAIHTEATTALERLDGWVADGVHHYMMRTHFEDIDAGGIIYHANYIAFAERARSSYLRSVGIFQEDYIATMMGPGGADAGDAGTDGFAFVVRRIEIDYAEPAGLGTPLRITSEMVKMGGASMKIEQIVINHENGHILARLLVDIVCVRFTADGGARPRRLPADVATKLAVRDN